MKKFKLSTPLFAVLAVLIFAGSAFSQTASKEPYVIGAHSSATGPGAFIGGPMRNGMILGAEMVNEAGGINGHPINLIFYDDGGDPSKAVLVVKKLVEEDKVIAVAGGSRSGNILAVVPYIEKAEAPYVSLGAATVITQPVKKWTFADAHTNMLATRKIIEHMVKNNIKKVGFLPDNTAYGDDAYKSFMKQKPDSIQVLVHETFGDKDTEFTPQLTKAKAAGVDACVVWTVGPPAAIIMKNAVMLGMNIPFYHTHGAAQLEYPLLAGDGARLMRMPSGKLPVADELPDRDPQKKILLDFRREYVKRFKEEASWLGAHGTDAIWILAGAMKRAGWPPNKAKIRDEIENTKNLVGHNGIYNITPTDHNGLTYESMVILKWEKGHFALAE
jgi:branched-chain amino acid transport system substrate-binding protein